MGQQLRPPVALPEDPVLLLPSTYMVAHNCPQLQFQRIQCLLQKSTDTRHAHDWSMDINANKTLIHIKILTYIF